MAIHYFTIPTRTSQSNNNQSNNRHDKRHGYRFNIQPVKYLLVLLIGVNGLTSQKANASDVGGVSATANPVANSSGSVTNQAIQVLQGPYITNTYGGGVSCQGPTLNFTPFLTGLHSFKTPYEAYFNDPVYDTSTDADGNLANPGNVLYTMPTRTGQKQNSNVSLGLSATLSIPLDRRLHKGCIRAANTQTNLNQQVLANKRLDFEMARLKHCGEQTKLGVTFHPKSPYASICADIIVQNVNVIKQHKHTISSEPSVKSVSPDSDLSGQESSPSEIQPSEASLSTSEASSLKSLSSALSPSEEGPLGVWQVGQMKSQQQQ
jgi:hypothetical protein